MAMSTPSSSNGAGASALGSSASPSASASSAALSFPSLLSAGSPWLQADTTRRDAPSSPARRTLLFLMIFLSLRSRSCCSARDHREQVGVRRLRRFDRAVLGHDGADQIVRGDIEGRVEPHSSLW